MSRVPLPSLRSVVVLALAPLTALGGTLLLIRPVLLTLAAGTFVLAAVPLYLLGGASVGTGRGASTPSGRTST